MRRAPFPDAVAALVLPALCLAASCLGPPFGLAPLVACGAKRVHDFAGAPMTRRARCLTAWAFPCVSIPQGFRSGKVSIPQDGTGTKRSHCAPPRGLSRRRPRCRPAARGLRAPATDLPRSSGRTAYRPRHPLVRPRAPRTTPERLRLRVRPPRRVFARIV